MTCLINFFFSQLSYAIGLAYPLSVFVDTYGTGLTRSGKTDAQLTEIVTSNFDLRPGGIIRDLNLRRPVLKKVGHYCFYSVYHRLPLTTFYRPDILLRKILRVTFIYSSFAKYFYDLKINLTFASHSPSDCRLWPLWPRRPRLHLGDAQGAQVLGRIAGRCYSSSSSWIERADRLHRPARLQTLAWRVT